MTTITTDKSPNDLLNAISTVTDSMNKTITENNRFAATMLNMDLDEAEKVVLETRKLIDAAQVLLSLAHDIIGDDEPEATSEYDL